MSRWALDPVGLEHRFEQLGGEVGRGMRGEYGRAKLEVADGHTARFTPATNFVGVASYTYTVTDNGEDPREFLRYSFEPPSTSTNGFVTDNSGHFRDGNLLALQAVRVPGAIPFFVMRMRYV